MDTRPLVASSDTTRQVHISRDALPEFRFRPSIPLEINVPPEHCPPPPHHPDLSRLHSPLSPHQKRACDGSNRLTCSAGALAKRLRSGPAAPSAACEDIQAQWSETHCACYTHGASTYDAPPVVGPSSIAGGLAARCRHASTAV